ncbi:MAG: enoyl-CoA hydratase/isomerase family protein [Thermodesulfobacteriota bacterium]|jgi:enoyl-CoA hydratase
MKFDTILLEKKGPIRTLIFNRPQERNKITYPLIEEINIALKQLRNDEEARVLIITGAGKAFTIGADLQWVQQSHYLQMRRFLGAILDILTQVEDLEIPVIAAINGPAIGGGFELICSCDFRIVSDSAVLGFPEIKLGSIPGASATSRLLRIVGQTKAAEITMLGNNITAREALAMNLVHRVVPSDQVMSTAFQLAEELAERPPLALKLTKKALSIGFDTDVKSARRFGLEAMTLTNATDDMREGLAAFLEKRQPVFKGK